MSKKDQQLIAQVLKETCEHYTQTWQEQTVLWQFADQLATRLFQNSTSFSRRQFMQDTGLES